MMIEHTRRTFLRLTETMRSHMSDRGATMVEYALLVVLLALVSISAIAVFGNTVGVQFSDISSSVIANT